MSAPAYSAIHIIYNPTSTSGVAEQRARRLARRLEKRGFKRVTLQATEHAGHAEELAYATARKYNQPLIVSVSGDGGYNEVVNGALRAQAETKHRPVCAILAAGNANDHRRTVRRRPLSWAITHTAPEPVDVLRLTAQKGSQRTTRYAHSYIGLGVSSQAAAELNEEKLSSWKEIQIVLATVLFKFDLLRIIDSTGKPQKLDSLVFANIHHMSKVLKWGRRTNLHDGLFRVAAIPHRRNPLRRLITLAGIATVGLRNPPQTAAYEFKIPGNELVHLDGEVIALPGGSQVRIEAVREALLIVR